MKLKLGEQDSVTILSLLLDDKEVLADAQIAILRAGINRLAATGKTKLVLDLTQASEALGPPLIAKMHAFMGQIPDPTRPMELIVASSIGPVTSVGEGVEVINAGLLMPTLQLDQLRNRRDRLALLQEKAQTRLEDLASDPVAIAIKDLKYRNAQIKRENRLLEQVLLSWRTQIRTEIFSQGSPEPEATIEKREAIRRLLQNLFAEKKYFESLEQASATEDPA